MLMGMPAVAGGYIKLGSAIVGLFFQTVYVSNAKSKQAF